MRGDRLLLVLGATAFAASAVGASGVGCAQIIGADFDKPFATGGGGAASTSTSPTSSTSTTMSTTTSGDTSSSASTGGPLCGNGVCDLNETTCGCPGDNCPQVVGDGCCDAPETWCANPNDCPTITDICNDSCCGPNETHDSCPGDCAVNCPNMDCDMPGGENCTTCPNDCLCDANQGCLNGACLKADGITCTGATDCASNNCVGTDCASGTCTDTICCALPCTLCQECAAGGGACTDLPSNAACPGNTACVAGLCQCADGTQDGNESDVDCGSDCGTQLCADGMKCLAPEDCTSGLCCDCAASGMLCETDCANCP